MKSIPRTNRTFTSLLVVAIFTILVAYHNSGYNRQLKDDYLLDAGALSFDLIRDQLNGTIKELAFEDEPTYGYALSTLCSEDDTARNKTTPSEDDATALIEDILAIDRRNNRTTHRSVESFFESMAVPETDTETRQVCASAALHFSRIPYFPLHSDDLTLMTTDEAFAHTCLLHSVVHKLEENAIESFVWWGSLLGAYRHHGPIPWHLDNDILVDESQRAKVVQVLDRWRHDDFGSFLWKWHEGREGVNIKMWYSRAERISPSHKYRYPFLDIWFYKVDGDTLRLNYWTEEDKSGVAMKPVAPGSVVRSSRLYTHEKHKDKYDDMHTVYQTSDFLPLVKRYFGGALVGTPVNTAKLLHEKFGNLDTQCFLGGWNHRKEVWVPTRPFDCCAVYGRLPFVDRSRVSDANGLPLVVETLTAQGAAVHHLFVDLRQRVVYMPP